MMRKIGEVCIAVVILAVLFWCLLHTREVSMRVDRCEREGHYYIIYVVDNDGEEYAYYSGDSLPYGTAVTCVFHGDEIVDVKGEY